MLAKVHGALADLCIGLGEFGDSFSLGTSAIAARVKKCVVATLAFQRDTILSYHKNL